MKIPEITIQISANSVAWYAAIVSTLGILISGYNAWRDRSRVTLSFGRNFRNIESYYEHNYEDGFYNSNLKQREKTMFYVSVINHGRRPVKIDKAWVKTFQYEEQGLLADSINTKQERVLEEKNPKITFWTDESVMNVDDIYCIYASDDTGRVYKKYLKKFWFIKKGCLWMKNKFKRHEKN